MAKPNSTLLTLEASTEYMRKNMGTEFPSTKASNKTISNIPASLHKEMLEYAQANKLNMYELLAGLWDFKFQYEALNAEALAAQKTR